MQRKEKGSLVDSFNAAIEGFLLCFKTRRNMRIHFLLALFILLFGINLNFTRIELVMLLLTCSTVLIIEMVNTAMEIAMDYAESAHSKWVKIVKDITAGAVLVASINAVIIGYLLFFRDNIFSVVFQREFLKLSRSDWHLSFFILITLLGIVIMSKAVFHKGKPLRGGMPSGHSAVAFSVWMLTALLTGNMLIIFAVFALACMIAQSRINRRYHTVWEVIAGAVLGGSLTLMIYRLIAG
jgi:diacylglycerol kinase (ATP)